MSTPQKKRVARKDTLLFAMQKESFVYKSNSEAANSNSEHLNLSEYHSTMLGYGDRFNKTVMIQAFDSMAAYVKMLAKKKIIGEKQESKLTDILTDLRKSAAKDGVKALKSDLYPAQVIKRLVEERNANLAEYLLVDANNYADFSNGDLKSLVMQAYAIIRDQLIELYGVIADAADQHVKTVMPVKMHGNVAQSTSLAHYLLSFMDGIMLNINRLEDAYALCDRSPYGVFNGAGSTLNINRSMIARKMGFAELDRNSHHAISDRSYVNDFLYAATAIMSNVSAIASDLLEWSQPNNGYITLASNATTQSSIQKGRADAPCLEMVRAQASVIAANLSSSIAIVNQVSSAVYSADFEVLNNIVDSSIKAVMASIKACSIAMSGLTVDKSRTKEVAVFNYSLAHDLNEWLISNTEMKPADCMNVTKQITDLAHKNGKKLSLLSLEDLQAICPAITNDVYSALLASRSIIAKRSIGGSNPVQVKKNIRHAKKRYA